MTSEMFVVFFILKRHAANPSLIRHNFKDFTRMRVKFRGGSSTKSAGL
jgi:hypothetical protein